ncbi:hypothetical protein Fmac_014573 [Flemingia macrophylla]|uniref:Uncharacterized protein n=1 Tax=Flemingia macrophylla TaxID=520843 RepID=A0ABD1MC56_9FABA
MLCNILFVFCPISAFHLNFYILIKNAVKKFTYCACASLFENGKEPFYLWFD